MPAGLTAAAKGVWKRAVKELVAMDIIGQCDANALGRYAMALANYWRCQKIIAKKGLTYTWKGPNGSESVKERPEVKLSSRLSEECRKLENLFGLNPSARASLAPELPSNPAENRGKRKSKQRFFKKASAG